MSRKALLPTFVILIIASYAKCEVIQILQSETLYQKVEETQSNDGSNVIHTTIVRSFSQCAILCTNHSECQAFTFENASICSFMKTGPNSSKDYYTTDCQSNNPCRNGGVCISRQRLLNNVICVCPAHYIGRYCEFADETSTVTYETPTPQWITNISDTYNTTDWTENSTELPLTSITSTTAASSSNVQYFFGPTGTILSPNYPENYSNNATVFYIIQVRQRPITFQVNFMDIEFSSRCSYDYVKIYDGLDTNSPLLRTLCGYLNYTEIPTFGDRAFLHFHTDGSVVKKGFNITYTSP